MFAFKQTEKQKYLAEFDNKDDVSKFEKLRKIGHGTFGEVFKARKKESGLFVALKRVIMDNEEDGFPVTAMREIKYLQLMKHENVVQLLEICRGRPSRINNYRSKFYLVFEFCDHDLAGLLSNDVQFSLAEIKQILRQIFNGLHYIHSKKIFHRDMKSANILLTNQGILKLADFGLARAFSDHSGESYTNRVVTLWYRPPELLLGERNYTSAIDMWGAGCIMAELWTREPIFKGSSEQEQLELISRLCGSITPDVWPNVKQLDLFWKLSLPRGRTRKVKDLLRLHVSDEYAHDLFDKLLAMDPNNRVSADDGLNHDFFWTDPMPCDLGPTLQHFSNEMFEFLAPSSKPPKTQNQEQLKVPPTDQGFCDRVF